MPAEDIFFSFSIEILMNEVVAVLLTQNLKFEILA